MLVWAVGAREAAQSIGVQFGMGSIVEPMIHLGSALHKALGEF